MSDLQSRSKLKGDTVTRTYKIFRFDPHLRRKALLIRGEVTVQISDSLRRQPIAEETKEFRKVVRLEAVDEFTDVSAVLDEVLERCPYIQDDLVAHLFEVIDVIKKRKYVNGLALAYQSGDTTPTFPDYFEDENLDGIDSDIDLREITMESLEYYVELLYEEIHDKVKGARCISKLCSCEENLPEIYAHETALNALFRTLREDYKKSMDLTTNILTISLSFATYRNFHPAFITNKICSLLMDIVEYELTRFDKWVDEIHLRKELATSSQTSSAKIKLEYEKMKMKFSDLTKRQDLLLCSGFNVVRLLSETPAFMQEITRRGIVKLLMACLERKSTELIVTVISFLKVLSAFRETTNQMTALEIIDIVHVMVDENVPKALLGPVLGLLYNLSFDTKLRQKMLKYDLLTKTATLLIDQDLQPLCIRLLYNFSLDERIRPKFAGTGTIGFLLQQIEKTPDDSFNLEAKALTLNLASSKRCWQIICGNGGLPILLSLAFQNEDALIMKIVRKLAQHDGPLKNIFVDLVSDIAGAIQNAPTQEFAIECVGTLGNLTIPDLDFKKLLQQYNLIPWMKSVLRIRPTKLNVPGEQRNFMEAALIEAIIFIGTCAGDPDCAAYLIEEDILEYLFDLCAMPNIDPDITIQILYAFHKFCSHQTSRGHIVENRDILDVIIELLRHDFVGIREIDETVLNMIGEHDDSWKARVKIEKFKAYNKEWIDQMNKPIGENITNQIHGYHQKQQTERFQAEHGYHEDQDHPDSGRSNKSSSSTSDTLTLSETETEDETDDNGETEYRVPSTPLTQPGIPLHPSKSIFDRFEHQFMQERGNQQESYEFGLSEEDDEGLNDSGLNGSFENFSFDHPDKESLHRRNNKSARIKTGENSNGRRPATAAGSRKLLNGSDNGIRAQNNVKTEEFHPSTRKISPKSVMSVEIKRKS